MSCVVYCFIVLKGVVKNWSMNTNTNTYTIKHFTVFKKEIQFSKLTFRMKDWVGSLNVKNMLKRPTILHYN